MKKILISISCMMFVLLGCSKKDKNIQEITVAEVTHSIFYAPQYYAMEKGYFEEEGIKLNLLLTPGADKVMSALLSKEAQIGLMGPEATIYVYSQNNKSTILNFAQLTQKDGSFLIGRNKETNFNFTSLKNSEIIGGRDGGMPEMTLEYVLKRNGLDIKRNDSNANVNVRTDIQFAAMVGAFISGEGDYVTAFEPTATMMEQQNQGYVLTSIGEMSGELPYTCYSTSKDFINSDPTILKGFVKAINKAQKEVIEKDALEIAKVIAPHFKEAKIEDLAKMIKRYQDIKAWPLDTTLSRSGFEKMQDIMALADHLEQRVDYEDVVTTQFNK